jgi:hypothetical protein
MQNASEVCHSKYMEIDPGNNTLKDGKQVLS